MRHLKRLQNSFGVFGMVVCLIVFTLHATAENQDATKADQIERVKKAIVAKLSEKLRGPNGKSLNVVLLAPMDYTNSPYASSVNPALKQSLAQFGVLNVREEKRSFQSLTLEEFRNATASYNSDIIAITIIQPNNYDLYVYDKRQPYSIYAYSEPIPVEASQGMTQELFNSYTAQVVRRTLFRFARDQYFELPRKESEPFLKSEIPRWIASSHTVMKVNRDIMSEYYAAASLGGAVSVGVNSEMWTASVLSAQFGFRQSKNVFLELGWDAFSMNTFYGGMKYQFGNLDNNFKFQVGAALGYGISRKVLNFDRTGGLDANTAFFIPSATILFPIVDVYLKAETHLLIGLTDQKYVFIFLPGLLVMF